MTLLLEDVRLALPFPHQQLAQRAGTKREPFATRVDRAGRDLFLRDAEGVHACKRGQLPEPKDARREAYEEKVRGRMESCADNFRAGLVKIVSIYDAPAGVGNTIDWIVAYQVGAGVVFILSWFFAPDEYCTISTDCVDLKTSLLIIKSGKRRVTRS